MRSTLRFSQKTSGQHQPVIARAHLAIGAVIAHERRAVQVPGSGKANETGWRCAV